MEPCTCKQCGNAFDVATRKDDMGVSRNFCSYSCHNRYYRLAKKAKKLAGLSDAGNTNTEFPGSDKEGIEGQPSFPRNFTPSGGQAFSNPVGTVTKPLSMKELPSKVNALSFSSFDPSAQFIIATLQDNNNRLEAEKSKLITDLQTAKDSLQDLKDKMREEILKKPSTLEGISESPIVKELIPHIGPALGQILNKFFGGGPGIAGVGGHAENLPEETNRMVSNLVGWFIQLPVELQTNFFNIVRGIAEKSPEDQVKLLDQLSNLVLNNSSFKQDFYAA